MEPHRSWRGVAPLLALGLFGCSSSKSTPDSGPSFGAPDGGDSGETKPGKDSGQQSSGKDAGSKYDGACGSNGESGWCTANSPNSGAASMPICDDFDSNDLSSLYSWVGVTPASLVNTHYVSPFCALSVQVYADGGPGQHGPSQGAFTEHPYPTAATTGSGTATFDLYVPSDSACDGAVVARFTAGGQSIEIPGDAEYAWLSVTSFKGSGSTPSGYTLSLTVAVGNTGDGGPPTPSSPVTVDVTPRASDDGWARVGIDVSSYVVAKSTATLSAKPTWGYRGETTMQGAASSAATATGSLQEVTTNASVLFDVGLPPGPTDTSVTGCQLYIDDLLTEL